ARKLQLTEGAISQHLKVLREAGLVTGVRKGYFMHYVVERHVLRGLATELERLASIELEPGALERGECITSKHASRSNCGTCLRRVDGFE
ncbi:MAG: helix-turn-helix transcriptional regulator, partial [Firmicutes bacterium]|nr:helix-turn-helix transcriptional regulator [Bacillota bacterium]